MMINIELKNSVVRYEGMEDQILELIEKWGMKDFIIYSSFNPDSIRYLKEKDPVVQAGILASPVSACLAYAKDNPVDALHPFVKNLDVADLKEKTSLPVRAWNTKAFEPFYPNRGDIEVQNLEELEAAGVTDIFTNVPERYLS